jgi:hypothetical protein
MPLLRGLSGGTDCRKQSKRQDANKHPDDSPRKSSRAACIWRTEAQARLFFCVSRIFSKIF